MSVVKRINKEYKDLIDYPLTNISARPKNNNIFDWEATIKGPEGSPYENGIFNLKIFFPDNYPFKAPTIFFSTKIYHPNINQKGGICLDILRNEWSPALTIGKVLLSISSLLNEPNPNDPLMIDIANIYKNNRDEFTKRAKEWTLQYAFIKS